MGRMLLFADGWIESRQERGRNLHLPRMATAGLAPRPPRIEAMAGAYASSAGHREGKQFGPSARSNSVGGGAPRRRPFHVTPLQQFISLVLAKSG